ncbi:porin family protein [Winogradskyella sp. DF17]|uniref:Porin family protein n=1 Tax=Winogradskyella pelagia TaxID=2819984 RepID=A0ABS3T0R8_9FLAO|nr:outer membrane beta-barrel protein [Winogradskyella sp. DF17]MBO3116338.1 porin family protein [Winogradskyella sp. DF17]
MKRILLSALAIFAFATISAQDEGTPGFAKGDVYASGTVGFNSGKQGDFKTNGFDFMPAVGYFISENIALEANLIVGSGKDEFPGGGEDKFSSFGGALGATYFFTPASRFSFTVGAGLSYVSTTFETTGSPDISNDTFAIAVSPGINYFVSNNFALRASVGALSYASSKNDTPGAEAFNTFGLNLDLSDINFGVTYKF